VHGGLRGYFLSLVLRYATSNNVNSMHQQHHLCCYLQARATLAHTLHPIFLPPLHSYILNQQSHIVKDIRLCLNQTEMESSKPTDTDHILGLLGLPTGTQIAGSSTAPSTGPDAATSNAPNDIIMRAMNAYRSPSLPAQVPAQAAGAAAPKAFLPARGAKEALKSPFLGAVALANNRDVRAQKTPAATSSSAAKNQEKAKISQRKASPDQKQRRGTVPCTARRMPPDHNCETAVFVLHKNMKHGEHLICSYPRCRDEGVKFCYCSLCGIPVAKRNFKSRHDHSRHELEAGRRVPGEPKQFAKRANQASDENPKNKPPKKRRKGEQTAQLPENIISEKASTANVVEPLSNRRSSNKMKPKPTKMSADKWLSEGRRMFYWNQLLEMRPEISDGEALGLWMDLVVLASNRRVLKDEVSESFRILLSAVNGERKRRGTNDELSTGDDASLSEFSSEISSSTQE
jgi:hypothetical protein